MMIFATRNARCKPAQCIHKIIDPVPLMPKPEAPAYEANKLKRYE